MKSEETFGGTCMEVSNHPMFRALEIGKTVVHPICAGFTYSLTAASGQLYSPTSDNNMSKSC